MLANGALLEDRRARSWWYLGVPIGIAVGAVLAVWLRTSPDAALTLRAGDLVDIGFVAGLDPPHQPTTVPAAASDRYLLVVFGYTSCPDLCPATLLAVHVALQQLGDAAEWVIPVFVTVDPARDTPDRLAAYVASFDPRIRSLSDPAGVAATLRALRARAEKRPLAIGDAYTMDHTAVVYVLNPAHRVIAAVPEAIPAETLTAALVAALRSDPGFGPHSGRIGGAG